MNRVSERTSRYLALTVTIILLLLLTTALYRMYSGYLEDRQFAEKKLKKIKSKLDYVSINKKHIKNAYRSYKTNHSVSKLYLNKSNPQRHLVAHVKHLNKTACGLEYPEALKYQPGDLTISFKYKTRCPYEDLYTLLFLMDNSKPLVYIEDLAISRINNIKGSEMDAEFVITGYIKG